MKFIAAFFSVLLWPLRWVKRQLDRQVRLRRIDGHWRLVLEPEASAEPRPRPAHVTARQPPGARALAAHAKAAQFEAPDPSLSEPPLDDMQRELRALLAQHEKTRLLMRHLAYLERALRLSGTDALETLPYEVIHKALAQLEGLVSDWSSPGLAELRLRLSMLCADKEPDLAPKPPPPPTPKAIVADLLASQRVQVSEATEAEFESAQKRWRGTTPGQLDMPQAASRA